MMGPISRVAASAYTDWAGPKVVPVLFKVSGRGAWCLFFKGGWRKGVETAAVPISY